VFFTLEQDWQFGNFSLSTGWLDYYYLDNPFPSCLPGFEDQESFEEYGRGRPFNFWWH